VSGRRNGASFLFPLAKDRSYYGAGISTRQRRCVAAVVRAHQAVAGPSSCNVPPTDRSMMIELAFSDFDAFLTKSTTSEHATWRRRPFQTLFHNVIHRNCGQRSQ